MSRRARRAVAFSVAVLAGLLACGCSADSAIPADTITVFIENISFGAPDIPDDFKKRPMVRREIEAKLAPLLEVEETITLSAEQAKGINALRDQILVPTAPVHPGRGYTMSEIVQLLWRPMGSYHLLGQWQGVTAWWSALFADAEARGSRRAEVEGFLAEELPAAPRLPDMMAHLLQLADWGKLDLTTPPECVGEALDPIAFRRSGRNWQLLYGDGRVDLVPNAVGQRVLVHGKALVDLLQSGCTARLAGVFAEASQQLGVQQELVGGYVDAWRSTLEAWLAHRAEIDIRVSNLSRFDMFARRDVRVGIGTPDQRESAIEFTASIADKPGRDNDDASTYVIVRRRSATGLTLPLELPEDAVPLRESPASTLRVALLVSSVEAEDVIVSQGVPFSREARERARREVDAIRIDFPPRGE